VLPGLPAGLYADILDLSCANKLAKGEQRALGNRINLKNVKCDVYLMAGSTDHNKHLRYWMANELPPNPDDWLANASETKGNWRDHWFKWLAAHSGDRVQAPSLLGSNKHPSLCPAPGRYVVEG
jgi:polyhydroxyalkanoate synthase subunit PhaC